MKRRMDFMFNGGAVKRYHTLDTLRTQTVAEHSYGVACLVYLLTDGHASADLIMAALLHDVAEHLTGDIPAPAKRRMEISAQFAAEEYALMSAVGLPHDTALTPHERKVLKLADTADLLLFCIREISLGNSQMHVVYERGMQYVAELMPHGPNALALVELIKEKYDDECK